MKCPVCKTYQQNELDLHADGFSEDIVECSICGTVWSVNHGLVEIVNDSQRNSFLEADLAFLKAILALFEDTKVFRNLIQLVNYQLLKFLVIHKTTLS